MFGINLIAVTIRWIRRNISGKPVAHKNMSASTLRNENRELSFYRPVEKKTKNRARGAGGSGEREASKQTNDAGECKNYKNPRRGMADRSKTIHVESVLSSFFRFSSTRRVAPCTSIYIRSPEFAIARFQRSSERNEHVHLLAVSFP
jgi:hypothetical protein